MRLLHVTPTYLPAVRYGGPIYSVHGLCAALAKRGHAVHVYTTNVDGPGVSAVPVDAPVEMDGVSVRYFATGCGRRLLRSPGMGKELAETIRRFDLVHLHGAFQWPTAAAASQARRGAVPYVLSPRGMLVADMIRRKSRWAKTAWIELVERRNVTGAAALHATAKLEAEELVKLSLDTPPISVIANGIELPAVEFDSGAEVEGRACAEPCILFLGRISWKKGLDRLIRAMAYVQGARLLVAGNDEEGYTPVLESLAQQVGVADRIRFLGPAYGPEKWRLMAAADVFALPSYSENFGIAVLEAMACGVPVVVSPEVGLAEAVKNTGAGRVVAGDPEPFGRALGELIARPDLRVAFGQAGRKAAAERFSWSAIGAEMEALYTKVTQAR